MTYRLTWRGKEVIDAIQQDSGVEQAMQRVLQESNTNAPKDTGELINSGRVIRENGTRARVTYTAKHAVPVHERTDRTYKRGGAKFLERAIQDTQFVLQPVAERLRDILR